MGSLSDILSQLDELPDATVIYAAAPWSASSPAVVTDEPEGGGLPPEAKGMKYLLEVDLAREAVEVWSAWRGGRAPTLAEVADAVIYYAEHDAYLPVEP